MDTIRQMKILRFGIELIYKNIPIKELQLSECHKTTFDPCKWKLLFIESDIRGKDTFRMRCKKTQETHFASCYLLIYVIGTSAHSFSGTCFHFMLNKKLVRRRETVQVYTYVSLYSLTFLDMWKATNGDNCSNAPCNVF